MRAALGFQPRGELITDYELRITDYGLWIGGWFAIMENLLTL